jgi:hypothetical protein
MVRLADPDSRDAQWTDEKITRLGDGNTGLGTRILGLVLEYDSLLTQGHSADVAVQTLRLRAARFGSDLIDQFGQHVGAASGKNEARELALRSVRPGMVMLQDVRTHLGTLLVPRGYEVSSTFLERIRYFGPDLLNETVKVLVPAPRVATP